MKDGFVFWVNEFSIHTQPLIEALADEGPVTVVAVADVAPDLARYGIPVASRASRILQAEESARLELALELSSTKVHIFTGFGAYPAVANIMDVIAQESPASLRVVFTEPWNPRGFAGWLRRCRYVIRSIRWGGVVDAVLATGDLGVAQFRSISRGRFDVAEFGYSVSSHAADVVIADGEVNTPIVFVGSLDDRKDPMTLLDAALRSGREFQVDIYGDGDYRALLELHPHAVAGNVTFKGVVGNNEVREALSHARLLVLPSIFDGWGAVVNEGLAAGTPVMVSEACGSASLARSAPGSGTFSPGDVDGLARELTLRLRAPWTSNDRRALAAWSERTISPTALADHLRGLVLGWEEGKRAAPAPWKRSVPGTGVDAGNESL